MFRCPYPEELSQQLRVLNAYGTELKPAVSPSALQLKLMDKSDEWGKRNQRGQALISMSVTKTVLNKIKNISNCREAYLLLQEMYGGPLTLKIG